MVEFTRTRKKTGKTPPEALTVAIKRSVVRQGRFLVELQGACVTGTSTVATLQVDGVAVNSIIVQATGAVVLEVDTPHRLIGSIGVDLAVDGEPDLLEEGKEHSLPRLVSAGFETVRVNAVRKGFRIDDPETLVETARQSYLGLTDNLLTRAVPQAVIGYCYVEASPGSSYAEVAWVDAAGNELRQGIDEPIAEEVRWATSIVVMLYQICIMGNEYGPAPLYVYHLYPRCHLVDVKPMCAYNIGPGIYLIGCLYLVAGRYAEASIIWVKYKDLFVKAVNDQRKSAGTMRELGTVWRNNFACVSGQTAAIRIAP